MPMSSQVIPIDSIIRVGFVDDEHEQIQQLKSHFAVNKEINALYSNDPTEAMGWVIQEQIDVLVFDMNLNGVNGIDFLEKARNLNQDIKLILFTGYILDKEQSRRCRRHGILSIKKHEGKESLEDNIMSISSVGNDNVVDKGNDTPNSELKAMLLDLASPLIVDLQKLAKSSQDIKIDIGEESYTPNQLIDEIESLTFVGRKFVVDFFSGLKILKSETSKWK